MIELLLTFFLLTANIDSSLQQYNPWLPEDRSFILAVNIVYASWEYKVPADILTAMVIRESHGKAGQYNRYGACGVMQIVYRFHGKDLRKQGICNSRHQLIWDDHANIMAGAWILSKAYKRYGNWDKALQYYSGNGYGREILDCLDWNTNCSS